MSHVPSAAARPAARPSARTFAVSALLLLLSAALLTLALPAAPARALDTEDQRNICLCTRVMARILCKKPNEFNYVDRFSDGTYSFSVFYADQVRPIRCQVTDTLIHLRADLGQVMLRSVPYTRDAASGCAVVNYQVPQCPDTSPIICCVKRSSEDQKKQEELQFWSKPIPELLQLELQQGIATDGNATDANATNATGTAPGN